MTETMDLALFDLDNTLLAGDSDYEWAQFLIDQGVLERGPYEAANDRFYQQYKDGTLDIYEFLDFQLQPLARHSQQELERWHEQFMHTRIRPIILERARALVDAHRQRGDLCAIVTATNSFITGPIAREFGVSELIATEPERRDGRYTGRPAGVPCFQAGKLIRIEEWLAQRALAWSAFGDSWFFSDSRNDVPLLEKVTRPVAVDPDAVLEAHARRRGWPIISLRN
jgi:HAD superfamily hydrolase (TIGR01490 family)